MAAAILRPRIIRGHLFFEVAGILFASRSAAICAASALLEGTPPVNQYRQDIWDSFPNLQKPPRVQS